MSESDAWAGVTATDWEPCGVSIGSQAQVLSKTKHALNGLSHSFSPSFKLSEPNLS